MGWGQCPCCCFVWTHGRKLPACTADNGTSNIGCCPGGVLVGGDPWMIFTEGGAVVAVDRCWTEFRWLRRDKIGALGIKADVAFTLIVGKGVVAMIGVTAATGGVGVVVVTLFDEQRHVRLLFSWVDGSLDCSGTGIVYGVDVGRVVMARLSIGLDALVAQTAAQGTNPTKRSPTGLASGCGWALMFKKHFV